MRQGVTRLPLRSSTAVASQEMFDAEVQRLSGRRVLDFISSHHVGPDLEIELFFLAAVNERPIARWPKSPRQLRRVCAALVRRRALGRRADRSAAEDRLLRNDRRTPRLPVRRRVRAQLPRRYRPRAPVVRRQLPGGTGQAQLGRAGPGQAGPLAAAAPGTVPAAGAASPPASRAGVPRPASVHHAQAPRSRERTRDGWGPGRSPGARIVARPTKRRKIVASGRTETTAARGWCSSDLELGACASARSTAPAARPLNCAGGAHGARRRERQPLRANPRRTAAREAAPEGASGWSPAPARFESRISSERQGEPRAKNER